MMDIKQNETGLVLVMDSSLEQIDSAEHETRIFLKQKGFETETFAVCLAMREGLTNAVRHGNRFSETKQVTFRLNLIPPLVRMEIEDQGDGFDWRSLPATNPTVSEHGHGWEIMQRYFDRCEYNDKGNVLILEKRIEKNKS